MPKIPTFWALSFLSNQNLIALPNLYYILKIEKFYSWHKTLKTLLHFCFIRFKMKTVHFFLTSILLLLSINCALALYVPGLYILKQNFIKFMPIKKLNAILLARYVSSTPTPNEAGERFFMCCMALVCEIVDILNIPAWCTPIVG